LARFITELKRTHTCGALTKADLGREVVLFGWIQNRRDHGGAVFIDLRDREGLTQVVFEADVRPEVHELAGQLRLEYCIGVRGKVVSRGANVNPKLKTGEIEVHATDLEIFNRSEPVPFPVEDRIDTSEEKRLQYRYLDLRRGALQRTLMTRARVNHVTRNYFTESGFLELETPFMVKYTPGGARNFLVPSRLNPGRFYALAESPQLFKQLYMIAGFDRYFQIVRCFRDEDLRLDRQPEFTQIDVEMSFVEQNDIFTVIEGLVCRLWKEVLGVEVPRPFLRMPFAESMSRYGNDKPDLRFELPHCELTGLVKQHDGGGVPMMKDAVEGGGIVKAIRLPSAMSLSRTEIEKLEEYVKGMGAKGLARAKVAEGGEWTQSPLAKSITPELRQAINAACRAGRPHPLPVRQGLRRPHGDGEPARPPGEEARPHPRVWVGRAVAVPVGGRSAPLRVRRGGGGVGSGPSRLHPPPRRRRPVPGNGPWEGELLPVRPGAERVRDRRRLDPPPRPRRPGARVQGDGDLGRGGAQQVRLPPRRPQDGRAAARRDRAGDGSPGDAPHGGGVAARRRSVAQDPEGNRPHDRRARRGRPEAAP
jgi:hypothetical protein